MEMLSSILAAMAVSLFLAIASDVAYSYIEVSGTIESNETWGPNETYYVSGDVIIDQAALTIEAGTVVKFAYGVSVQIIVDHGTLDVNGTEGNYVIFTSMNDNSYGETIPGSSGNPGSGDWNGSIVDRGTSYFDYCRIRYGGGGTNNANVCFDQSGSGSYFRNSISEYSAGHGVLVDRSGVIFRDSHIENNSGDGIYVDGTPVPDLGTAEDPGSNYIGGNGGYEINNQSDQYIVAYGNQWGSGGFNPPGSVDDPTMVVLSSFTAAIGDGKVTLLWHTEAETNNVGFAIYKSDARDSNYSKISFIPGAEDSEIPSDYQFTDEQVQPGHTYCYYLENVDLVGESTKSDVIQVTLAEAPHLCKPELPTQTRHTLPIQTKQGILPGQNSLLVNYPNPFNPETWIPYELAETTDVIIQIYDVRGHLIRTLHLGYQLAGLYLDEGRAAHWDGRDDIGEPVGSGIYFYRLSAGRFSAVRKMVILE
jgi:hypothetical protein